MRWSAAGASALLALACAAKLYPVILLPLFVLSFCRTHGWKCAAVSCLTFAAVLTPLAWPMIPKKDAELAELDHTSLQFDPAPFDLAQVAPRTDDAPPVPPQEVSMTPRDPSESLRAFLREWEMNDFLFLILIENLRPTAGLPSGEVAWFSIVPEDGRLALIEETRSLTGIETSRAPFFLTRAAASIIFIVVAGWLAWRASRAEDGAEWLNFAFLTVAWFWLLLPTLNPWYWTWAVPLLPFSRNRTWLAMSGLVFVYYLRFWLMHHFADGPLLGTAFNGPMFFDFVVTWLEFCPWFIVLAVSYYWGRRVAPENV